MVRERVLGPALVVIGVVLFVLGFATQECGLSLPASPNATTSPGCIRPAFPFVLLIWVPALVVVVSRSAPPGLSSSQEAPIRTGAVDAGRRAEPEGHQA